MPKTDPLDLEHIEPKVVFNDPMIIKNKTHRSYEVREAVLEKYAEYTSDIVNRSWDTDHARPDSDAWQEMLSNESISAAYDLYAGINIRSAGFAKKYHLITELEEAATRHFLQYFSEKTALEADAARDSILKTCSQLLRYVPELSRKKASIHFESYSTKLSVTIQQNGTLVLIIGETSEIQFSYAKKKAKGTTRISGSAKLTNYIENSSDLWKVLSLLG